MELSVQTKDFTQHHRVRKILEATPILLKDDNLKHIKAFRELIEWSLSLGRWSGCFALLS